MTDKELQEFEDWARKAIEASKFEAMPQVEFPEAVWKLATEVRRLRAVLTELEVYNYIKNDREAYMSHLANWALGTELEGLEIYRERPDPKDYGME